MHWAATGHRRALMSIKPDGQLLVSFHAKFSPTCSVDCASIPSMDFSASVISAPARSEVYTVTGASSSSFTPIAKTPPQWRDLREKPLQAYISDSFNGVDSGRPPQTEGGTRTVWSNSRCSDPGSVLSAPSFGATASSSIMAGNVRFVANHSAPSDIQIPVNGDGQGAQRARFVHHRHQRGWNRDRSTTTTSGSATNNQEDGHSSHRQRGKVVATS